VIGVKVGVYRVVRQIGEGGMGAVWLAEHVMLGRPVAIKVLHRDASARPELVERFFNEAKAATAISDPGIIQIFDFGHHTDGNAYIVMELLEGEPLDQRLRRMGKLPLASALRILRQVASSLGAAHRRGIVHRDLKPDNIFLVRDPEVAGGERTKVLDFGIAKLSTGQGVKTQTSAVMGTPVFMSPEQCRGAGQVDQRSDVYSLGCVLYTLLTGQPPFDGEGPGDIIAMHLREAAPKPSSLVPGLPPEIDALVLRCLAKDRDQRYESGTELASALEGLIAKLAPLFATPDAPASARTVASGEIGRPKTGPSWPSDSLAETPVRPMQRLTPPVEQAVTLTPVPPPPPRVAAMPSPLPPVPPMPPVPAMSTPSVPGVPNPLFAMSPPSVPSVHGAPNPLLASPPVTLETMAAGPGGRAPSSASATTLSTYNGARVAAKRPQRYWVMGSVAVAGAILGIVLVSQMSGGDEPSPGRDGEGSQVAAAPAGQGSSGSAEPPKEPVELPAPVEPGAGSAAPSASPVPAPPPAPVPAPPPVAPDSTTPPVPPADPAVERTEKNLRAVLEAFAKWAPDNVTKPCPTLSTLGLLLDPTEHKDSWGKPLRITCAAQPPALQMGAVSAGRDGKFATGDDILSWRLAGTDALVRGPRWVAKTPEPKPPSTAAKTPGSGRSPVIGKPGKKPAVPDDGIPKVRKPIDKDGDGIPDSR
jgi:serine/threonine protein kinase